MKTRFLILLLMLQAYTQVSLGQKQTLEEVLHRLDEAVAKREEKHSKDMRMINDLKHKLEFNSKASAYDIAETIMMEYEDISTDSAIYYAKRMLETAGDDIEKQQNAKINLAFYMIRRGEYAWAENMLSSLGKNINEKHFFRFYHAWDMLRTWENEHLSPNNEIRNSRLWDYADSMYNYRSKEFDIAMTNGTQLIYTNPQAALDTLKRVERKWLNIMGWRYLGKRLGLCYQQLGIRDSAEYYLALSALTDMEAGVVEHTSLHLLSLMLLEDKDIQRAYHYTRAAMDDALRSGVRLRLEQVARSMPTVLDAYYQELETRQQRINIIMYILVGLLLLGSAVMYYIYRINTRLSATRRMQHALNDELIKKEKLLSESLDKQTALVAELSNSSKMKDLFVGQYMRQCVNNIQQLEHYRLSLQKVAAQGSMDKLVKTIKKSDFIEEQLERFYHGFDESFLQIYPHFVDDFNALLREECRIKVPEGKLLTVDLRIHALIRLGLTDTEDIANFLHYSTQTIYNYRSRMRNSAICSRDEFEQKVRNLGE